jgi:hypothetical protein
MSPTSATAVGVIPVTQITTPKQLADFPRAVTPAVIAVKQLWANQWLYNDTFELVRCGIAIGGHQPGSCEFQRRYGANVKSPHQGAFEQRRPLDLKGWWVKVTLVGDQSDELVWIGRISTERREVFSSTPTQSGIQHWVAYEPLHGLQKIHVHESIWAVPVGSGESPPVEQRRIGWIPDMNVRDTQRVLVGNRSGEKHKHPDAEDAGEPLVESYLYGGTETWSRLEYLEYILKRFADESIWGGPRWEIGGQTDILAGMTDAVKFDTTQTVGEILRTLISPRFGVDFKIVPITGLTPTPGFAVHIFALSGDEHSYGGFTLPRNPNKFTVKPAELKHAAQTHIVSTLDQQYDRINVVGARMVVCCSLRADDGSLVPKWTAALEAEYKAALGREDEDVDKHERARRNSRFAPVYGFFGAPTLWDMNDGAAVGPHIADDGSLTFVSSNPPDYQNLRRRTMTALPLREALDYSVWPARDKNPADFVPDLQKPMVFVFNGNADEDEPIGPNQWGELAEAGLGDVSVLNDDWGVALNVTPNYVLGLNHFDPDTDNAALVPGEVQYDYEMLVATIALETDQRLRLRHELISGTSEVGDEMTIEVPDAELWVLATGAVVGVDPATGQLQVNTTPRVLRNDIARLSMIMAGAIARYNMQRARAEIRLKGYWPHAGLLSRILELIEENDDTEYVNAPVTSVEWIGGAEPMTIFRAGMAR